MTASSFSTAFLSVARWTRATLAALGLVGATLAADASVLDTRTVNPAGAAAVYDTYHDRPTGFVFVKLPSGWRFVSRDVEDLTHEVFYDAPTGFVFVKTSAGWQFVPSED